MYYEQIRYYLKLGASDNLYIQIQGGEPLLKRDLKQAFNLGEKLAEKTGTKCILMIDEFPDILAAEIEEIKNIEEIKRR